MTKNLFMILCYNFYYIFNTIIMNASSTKYSLSFRSISMYTLSFVYHIDYSYFQSEYYSFTTFNIYFQLFRAGDNSPPPFYITILYISSTYANIPFILISLKGRHTTTFSGCFLIICYLYWVFILPYRFFQMLSNFLYT